jgi:hypothetical protein
MRRVFGEVCSLKVELAIFNARRVLDPTPPSFFVDKELDSEVHNLAVFWQSSQLGSIPSTSGIGFLWPVDEQYVLSLGARLEVEFRPVRVAVVVVPKTNLRLFLVRCPRAHRLQENSELHTGVMARNGQRLSKRRPAGEFEIHVVVVGRSWTSNRFEFWWFLFWQEIRHRRIDTLS